MRVLVLYGGDSPERDVSVATGRAVSEALKSRGHDADLFDPWSSTGGLEVRRGGESALRSLVDRVGTFVPELVFVALHGGAGEDGTVQAALDLLKVPYTGSGVAASAVAMDKVISKRLFSSRGIPTPEWVVVDQKGYACGNRQDAARELVGSLGYPVVTKPVCGGSTVGTTLVRDETNLETALDAALRYGDRALVERYIPGRELTVALLDGLPFPVVEIRPHADFYDYEAKYTAGRSTYEVPADLPYATGTRVQALATDVYELLACSGVARVDFRLEPSGVAYCLEANVVPGLTSTSLVPKAAGAAGVCFADLVERICRSGVETRRR